MKVKDLIEKLKTCNGNWEVILYGNHNSDFERYYIANTLYCGNYNYAERDCGAPTFKNSCLDPDGKDLNAILIK